MIPFVSILSVQPCPEQCAVVSKCLCSGNVGCRALYFSSLRRCGVVHSIIVY